MQQVRPELRTCIFLSCEQPLLVVFVELLDRELSNVDEEHVVIGPNQHVERSDIFDAHVLGKEEVFEQRRLKPSLVLRVGGLGDANTIETFCDEAWQVSELVCFPFDSCSQHPH